MDNKFDMSLPETRDTPMDGFDTDLQTVRNGLVNRALYVMAGLGLPALIGTILRTVATGWHPVELIYIALYLVTFGTVILIKRLSFTVRASVLIGVLFFLGVSGLFSFGLAANGILILAIFSILTSVLFGTRSGFIATVISLGIIGTIGVCFITNIITFPYEISKFITSLTAWVTAFACFVFLVGMTVICTGRIQQYLTNALKELSKHRRNLEDLVMARTVELTKANEQLKVENKNREHAEKTLRESENKYQAIFKQAADSIIIINADTGELEEFNEKAYKHLGYTRNEFKKLTISDIDIIESPEEVAKHLKKIIKGGSDRFETKHRNKGGEILDINVSSTAISIAGKNLVQSIWRDVTSSKQAEEKLLLQREELTHVTRVATLGELAASLAHEINQPLTAILSNAQAAQRFLNRDNPDLEEVRDILADIISDDKRAGDVIRQLRSLFRKEALDLTSLDINSVIEQVITLVKSEAIIRNVSVEIRLDRSLPPVPGDRVHLQQLILNSILNASEALADSEVSSRKVIISTGTEDGKDVKVGIRDYGRGIDEENLDQIFKPFYTTKAEGLGMGLSINRSIIEAHGGRAWAENNPAGGAAFYYTIPVRKEN